MFYNIVFGILLKGTFLGFIQAQLCIFLKIDLLLLHAGNVQQIRALPAKRVLVDSSWNVSDELFQKTKQFTCHMYVANSSTGEVNKVCE